MATITAHAHRPDTMVIDRQWAQQFVFGRVLDGYNTIAADALVAHFRNSRFAGHSAMVGVYDSATYQAERFLNVRGLLRFPLTY